MGNVTNNWLITSGGVIIADRIKITTMECLLYFLSTAELYTPILANRYIITGSSKNSPVKNVDVVIIDM